MNHWHMEVMAELHRREIQNEVQVIHIAERANAPRPYHAGWFAIRMFGLANWMIATGKNMRRRYQSAALGCAPEPTRGYVR